VLDRAGGGRLVIAMNCDSLWHGSPVLFIGGMSPVDLDLV
jgi:hypothetical protein